MKYVDRYDLRARVLPALLCVMPAPLALWSFYGDEANWWRSGVMIAVTCGFVFLLSRVARDAGKRLQERLFQQWGGPPTTQLLRHSNDIIDHHSKAKLHERLGQRCGVVFPTSAQETEDSAGADNAYRAGAGWLLQNTRDTTKFDMLFKENINFGFQRNALGLKWIGVLIALTSIFGLLASAGVLTTAPPFFHMSELGSLTPAMALSLLLSIVLLAIWLFAITAMAAKRTAFAYADRLMEAANAFE